MNEATENRRASRAIVDVDAELKLPSGTFQGTIHDLSFLGSLFLTDELEAVPMGTSGRVRFVLPTSASWFEPAIEVRRSTTFPRPRGLSAQAIGFQFSGLEPNEERAIALACLQWDSYSSRQFPLAAQCFVQGQDVIQNLSRFARLTSGSRQVLQLRFPGPVPLEPRNLVRLRVGRASVGGRVSEVYKDRFGTDVTLRVEGWGGDFFLHEARREAVGAPS